MPRTLQYRFKVAFRIILKSKWVVFVTSNYYLLINTLPYTLKLLKNSNFYSQYDALLGYFLIAYLAYSLEELNLMVELTFIPFCLHLPYFPSANKCIVSQEIISHYFPLNFLPFKF